MIEAKNQIGFEQAGLGSILKRNQLVVPTNQREYSWTDREVKRLFQDFARAIADGGNYFLGTIVTIPRSRAGHELEVLEVVDGQQRLATTAILLAAIRNYLVLQNESVIVESINNEFLTGIDRVQRQRVPKLTLNIDDNQHFSQIVTGETVAAPLRSSHRLLQGAAQTAKKHVRDLVSTFDTQDHGDHLNRWVSFIEHGALAVLLRVPDDADAYRMFETLNDRGLRTSQADLIKNYLISRATNRIGEVQSKWAYMRGALESLEDDDITTINFLRHALIVLGGFLREAEVYERVQESVKSEQSAVTFASELEQLANAYVASFNPEHAKWNEYPDRARRAIEVFNLLDIRPMRPLILAVAAKMEKREAAECFEFLLSLGVRLLIASSTRSGSVEIPLAEAAHLTFDGSIDNASKLRAKLDSITPGDRDFRESFEDAKVSNARFARYYLRSLEMGGKGESEPWFIPTEDRSIINLEHVLPKKPDASWAHFTDEDVKSYVNRLGNLALMRASNNTQLGNDSFAVKREVFAASPYSLTNQIAEFESWTPDAIDHRQKQLAEIALRTWPVRD